MIGRESNKEERVPVVYIEVWVGVGCPLAPHGSYWKERDTPTHLICASVFATRTLSFTKVSLSRS